MRNIEGWLRDHIVQVKILKLNLGEEGSLDHVLYPISFPLAVRTSRTLVHLSLSTSRSNRLITLSQHWDVPTLKEVSLCGFALNDEDGVICGCHNINKLTLQSCCYGGPNEIMKLVLKKFLVLKIEDWNDRGNHSRFSVNVDAPLLTDLVLVKHSPNLMFTRPMNLEGAVFPINLKGAVFSLKRYKVNGWIFGNTILNMLDQLRIETLRVSIGYCQAILVRNREAGTSINVAHTHIIILEDDGDISNVGIQHMVNLLKKYVTKTLIFESS
ncbi:hypothetical protein FXO37_00983 [Capsicum annuum]|nr:hypothetical protein FXO37_00983 [Capsicum annuum]